MIAFCPHPYRVRSESDGFSHGLKKCPPDTFLPRLCRGRPFESQTPISNKSLPHWGRLLLLCDLDTIDVTFTVHHCDHNSLMPTPVAGAFIRLWILPRPKNSPPDCFYPGCAGAGLSNPVRPSKNDTIQKDGVVFWRRVWDSNPRFLAESPVFKTGSLNHSDNSP